MYRIKVERRYYQAQGPPLSTRVSFVRIDPADCKLAQDNHTVSDSLFSVSSYILVLRYIPTPTMHMQEFQRCKDKKEIGHLSQIHL